MNTHPLNVHYITLKHHVSLAISISHLSQSNNYIRELMDDPPSSQDVKDVVWDHSSTTVHSSSPQNHKSLYDLAKLRAIFSSSTTSNTTTVESDEKAQILSFPSSHNDREEGDEEEQVRKRKQPASPTYPFDSPNESKSSSEKQKGMHLLSSLLLPSFPLLCLILFQELQRKG